MPQVIEVGNLANIIFYLYKHEKVFEVKYPSNARLELVGRDAYSFPFTWSELDVKYTLPRNTSIVYFNGGFYALLQSRQATGQGIPTDMHVAAGRGVYEILDTDNKEITINHENYDTLLQAENNEKNEIRQSILKYINNRYQERHDKVFRVYEIVTALGFDYEAIIFQIKYFIREDVLQYAGDKSNLETYPNDQFIIFEIEKGPAFKDVSADMFSHLHTLGVIDNQNFKAQFPSLDLDKCDKQFKKALKNLDADPETSLGNACSYIETVAKHILDYSDHRYPKKQDIQSLIGECVKLLYLSPDTRANKELNTINRSISNIASSIGAIRTHFSDFHGKGIISRELGIRHARYVVNLAHSISIFLIESFFDTVEKSAADS